MWINRRGSRSAPKGRQGAKERIGGKIQQILNAGARPKERPDRRAGASQCIERSEAPPAHEDKPTGLGLHLKVPLIFCPENLGHGMEFAMAPLDTASAQQDTLTLIDEQLRGERLTVDSADKKWPPGRNILFVLVTSFVLWTGIYFGISSVF